MSDRFDLVLFPKGGVEGVTASSYEILNEDENIIRIEGVFNKPRRPEPEPPAPQAPAVSPVVVVPEPDTSPDLDYSEFPDLPDAS